MQKLKLGCIIATCTASLLLTACEPGYYYGPSYSYYQEPYQYRSVAPVYYPVYSRPYYYQQRGGYRPYYYNYGGRQYYGSTRYRR
jgi:hypothetical protein